jgi:MscS family membrane protein
MPVQDLIDNRYFQAFLIAAAGIAVARLVAVALAGQIRRWTRRTATTFDDRMVHLLEKPVTLTVALIGLVWATQRLRLPIGVEWITLGVLKSLIVLLWMIFSFRFVNLARDALAQRGSTSPVPERSLPLMSNLAKVLATGIAAYFIFLTWGIDPTAWLASAGIIGLALGFAAKDTLANLFAGVFIMADTPYKVGDFIVLSDGQRGLVTQIGIRSTRILTRDDIEITVPNAVIGGSMITNESGGPSERRRLRLKLQVAYGTDVDRLREVLMEIAEAHPEVSKQRKPRVRFRSFGDSGLDFELLVWIDLPIMRGRVQDALNTAIYKRLPVEGIQIPYPVRELRIVRDGAVVTSLVAEAANEPAPAPTPAKDGAVA